MAKAAIKADITEKITVASYADADEALKMIGELEDFVSACEAKFNATVTELKAELVEKCDPVKKALRRGISALKKWAARAIPGDDGERKARSIELNFGWVRFRWTPPAIKFKLEEETVIERLRARGMHSCIRTIEAVDKDVLAAYDDDILKAIGAYRDQEEKFYYEVKREEVK